MATDKNISTINVLKIADKKQKYKKNQIFTILMRLNCKNHNYTLPPQYRELFANSEHSKNTNAVCSKDGKVRINKKIGLKV